MLFSSRVDRMHPLGIRRGSDRRSLPMVTTTIDSMVGVPGSHAYDALIREASTALASILP